MLRPNELVVSAVLFCLVALFSPSTGVAGLPVPPPPPIPPLLVPAPPPVFLVPGTYVYFAPDVESDLLFYHGFWYRPYGGGWYRASHYGGPWGFVPRSRVPHAVDKLPPGFRSVPPWHTRIPYGQLRNNWKTWEQERHWDKVEHKSRHDSRSEHGPEKSGRSGKPGRKGHGGKGHGK